MYILGYFVPLFLFLQFSRLILAEVPGSMSYLKDTKQNFTIFRSVLINFFICKACLLFFLTALCFCSFLL
jgi:hypothetical protein